jgi:lipopolysaccharide/colanic/teichoic acid biosynthesis glycosyltransferase
VLKGEMFWWVHASPGRDVSKFEEAWLMRRFCVTPGLTGLWQATWQHRVEDWVRHDFEYIDNCLSSWISKSSRKQFRQCC